MSRGNPIIGGSGMAVLIGVVLAIGSWFSGDSLSFFQKLALFIFGLVLIFLGIRFSKG